MLLTTGMRGRQLVDDALARRNLTASPQVESDSIATLLAHVRTGRWASIVPQTWLDALGPPAGVRVLRLTDPAVTTTVVLVTGAQQPGSVLTRTFADAARAGRCNGANQR